MARLGEGARIADRLARETEGEVLFDTASRGRYATDASIYQVMPAGVFVPRTADDVAAAIAICRELGMPLLARGAATSQCGQTTTHGLVVDTTKHLRSVVSVDENARVAVVEPGLVLDELNAQLKRHGLWFPVDVSTSAQATLGGMAGNNSCGSRSIAYGNMVHNVLSIDAWLSDGSEIAFGPVDTLEEGARAIAGFVRDLAVQHAAEIDARWPKLLRRVGGYNLDIFRPQSERPYTTDGNVNLAHLLVGSEGTLAVTRRLTLKLAPLPRHKVLGVVNFPTFRRAMEAAQHLVTLGPTAVELVDRTMIELARANPAFRPVIEAALIGAPEAILLVEFAGEDRAALLGRLGRLVQMAGDLGLPRSVVEMPEEAVQKALWEVRKAGLNIMMSLRGDGKPVSFIEDCAVPLEHLADYTDALTDVFARHGTRGTWYAHASVGTLHVRPILDMRRDGAVKMRAIAEEASALVRRYRGAYSGEHGDGLCRGEWIRWQFGPALDAAFHAIKDRLDPIRLFAPGRMIDPPKMDDAQLFRYGPGYRTIALKPVLDWSAWDVQNDPATEAVTAPGTGADAAHGFAKAVEMCNHNGHCRKFDAGTMCPSYRATRDEQHLTRGRATTLRLALSNQLGDLGPDPLASDAVAAALDLCVSCKGCKRECPTGVDMARMKIEATARRKAARGHTLRDRLIAALPALVPLASTLPALFNARNDSPWLRRLGERTLGLSASRALPRWRRDIFARTAASLGLATRDAVLAAERPVVLFVDTFDDAFESENAVAAVRVLQAAGYAVHAPSAGAHRLCCGRTALAAGMPELAKARARALVEALAPFATRDIPIVGLEPSCLLGLRDEIPAMGIGAAADVVARHAWLLEEFIAREADAGRFAIALRRAERPILLHGHCHQKAFGAMPAIVRTLQLLPGAHVSVVETSCCGMAGSFGYEAEHHAISLRMAELALLPAMRAAPDALWVADGTSCRAQIADGTGREARHVARLLADHLA
ncbi:MAG TPA: FAD-linked oxidase C-terminal domain-containing protein [Caldimonas sp.]|nr:FAD-linked oxidase C-terminal domain-containing protein [Caldimonas sp.]